MAKFKMTVLVPEDSQVTARLGSGTITAGTQLVQNDQGKLLKFVADSRYDVCAEGDYIQGKLTALEAAPLDDYVIGTVQKGGRMKVTCNGLQATHGTGTIAVDDHVVCSAPVAAGTALGTLVYPKVAKKTVQPGGTLADLPAAAEMAAYLAAGAWKVVSVTADGTVGDTAVIEKV